jgi:hypothetical protein
MLAGMMQVSRTEKYARRREMLNEKQWRHYLALEAQEQGSVAEARTRSTGITKYDPAWLARSRSR